MSKIAPVRITDVSGSPMGTSSNPVYTQSSGDSSSTGGIGGDFIGKVSGGDFTVAYASPTTLTLGTLPDGSSITGDDIVLLEQINVAGSVVQTYTRSEATMTMAGNVLTVAGAVFVTTDLIVITTNIPRNGGVLVGADAQTNATLHTTFLSRSMGYNGTTWDRVRVTTTGKILNSSEYAEDTVFADASYVTLAGQEIDDPTALATMTEGDVGNIKGDLSGRTIVTLGTLSAGENLTDNLVQVAMKPVATATNTYSRDTSVALEASSISKASAGNLYRAFGVIDASAATDIYYIQFLDSATLTADGAVTHLITPIPVNHTTGTDSSFDTGHFDAGVAATAGIVIVASTTMVLKTIAGSILFATVLHK